MQFITSIGHGIGNWLMSSTDDLSPPTTPTFDRAEAFPPTGIAPAATTGGLVGRIRQLFWRDSATPAAPADAAAEGREVAPPAEGGEGAAQDAGIEFPDPPLHGAPQAAAPAKRRTAAEAEILLASKKAAREAAEDAALKAESRGTEITLPGFAPRTGSTLETVGSHAPDVVGVAARAHQALTRTFEGVIANRIPVELREGVRVVENAFDVGTQFTIGLPAKVLSLIAAAGADIAWKDVLASFKMAQDGQRSPITAIFHALGFVVSRAATIGLTPVVLILEAARHLISKILAGITIALAEVVLGIGLGGKIILPPAFRGIVTGLRVAITPFAWILYLLRQGFVWLAGNYAIESNTQSAFERDAAKTSKKELDAAKIAKTAAERHLALVKVKDTARPEAVLELQQATEALKEAEAKLVEAERFAEIDKEVVALGISELQMAFAGLTPFLIFERGFSWALPLTTSRIAMGQALLKDLSLEELAGHIDSMLISRDRKLQLFAAAKHYKDVRDFRYEGKPIVEGALEGLKQVWGSWDSVSSDEKDKIALAFEEQCGRKFPFVGPVPTKEELAISKREKLGVPALKLSRAAPAALKEV